MLSGGGGLRSEHHIHVIIHPASIDLPSHLMKKNDFALFKYNQDEKVRQL